jgi:hypothetical protein
MSDIPDREWYENLSKERVVSLRCPFATVESCPRYYKSLSLLGEAGNTKIPEEEDERLLKHWKSSDLWPRTDEQRTYFNPSGYWNFCPEVTFEQFGYFAKALTKYGDEIDLDSAHQRLAKDGVPHNDPHWSWASCTGQHFTECPIYAVLSHRDKNPKTKTEAWWRKYLAQIVTAVITATIAGIIKMIFG